MSGPSIYDELLPVLDALALCAEPMFAINERHRVVFWNRPLEHLLGWTYDDVVGHSCGSVLRGCDSFGNRYCTDPCPIVSIAQRGESAKHFDLVVRTKSGERVPVDVAAIRFILPKSKRPILAHLVQPSLKTAAPDPPQPMLASHLDARVRELTRREIEVLGMVAHGQGAAEIAQTLRIAPLTARNHIQHILEKLELHSKSEVVAFAYRMHLVGSG